MNTKTILKSTLLALALALLAGCQARSMPWHVNPKVPGLQATWSEH